MSVLLLVAIGFIIWLLYRIRRLQHAVRFDGMTGVCSRIAFDSALNRLQQADEQFALLYIDCNQFKQLNDTHGHATGDRVLCAVAAHIQLMVRPMDMVARLGGDEFGVILRGCLELDAQQVCRRIMDFECIGVTLSCGLATSAERNPLSVADARMYAIKHSA